MATSITELELDGTIYPLKDEGAVRSITVGTTTTGGPDSAAKVENSGTDTDIILDFTVPQGPKGDTGETGKSATIAVGQVTTGRPGTDVMIVNAGDENHGIFDFTIPQGEKGEKGDQGEQGIQGETGVAATIEIGTVTTGAAGTTARVSNVGTETAAIFNFIIPQGEKGDKGDTGEDGVGVASVEQTESSTESSGKNTMTVTLTDGTISIFNVYNGARGATGDPGPQGEKGEKGDPGESGSTGATGESATIEIGETTTGDAGTEAQVTNSGTSTNAILNFTIPKGDQGEQGIQGDAGPQGDVGPQGEAATIDAGEVTLYSLEGYDEYNNNSDDPDTSGTYPAYIINAGTTSNAIFDFYLPQAQAATIEIGAVGMSSELTVKNAGTKTDALLDFTFPSLINATYDPDSKTLTFEPNSTSQTAVFAIYSDSDDSLTFYVGDVVPSIGASYKNKNVSEIYRRFDSNEYSVSDLPPWNDRAELIKIVTFDSSFADTRLKYLSYWFYDFMNCLEINMQNLNTSKVVNMEALFENCSSLISLDITNLETPLTGDMSYMFSNCNNLTTLDISSLNTSNVSNMDNMFENCGNLITLDISNFDTTETETMNSMFQGCGSLITIYSNDSVFNVENIDSSNNMFEGCESLVGGNGTTYNEERIDASMAHIDIEDNPGYFTAK